MSADFDGLREIFLAALDRPPTERDAYLDQACAGNSGLRDALAAMLKVHVVEKGPLDRGPPGFDETSAFEAQTESPGDRIGPYKLLQRLGEGGMGVVFVAEQSHPVQRRVALKIVKPGMDSRSILARFEAERQALALMDHPGIARVFDAGATEAGRPYFVMELVKGVPITKFCDERHLTPRQRLELFVEVCHAVQHAHQKGVIHRDLKPSNVLVAEYDDRPVPKVIDFGVAKATSAKLTERTLFTELGAVVGTLEYMSPEQAKLNALDVDTRSDVYALGVLLYELLAGTTPFDRSRLRQAAFDEVLRIIREEEPQKPSTRLSTTDELPSIAAMRGTEPKRLSGIVRGELDWIVMKALEKDRDRRYETANGFAMDVERYLAGEVVQACPPSAAYRLRKFVRRNKPAVFATVLILLTLLAGVIGVTQNLTREQRHRQELEAAHGRERLLNERARQAIETVMSEAALEQLARQKDLRSEQKDFLDKMLQYYAESTKEAAATEEERSRQQRAYHRMGRLNQILGRSETSENAYRRAVALGTRLVADFPARPEFGLDLATSYNALALLLGNTLSREKESAYGEALFILKRLAADFPARQEFRQTLAGVHNNLGNLYHETGRTKEAEDAHTEALAVRKQLTADFPTGRNLRRALAMSHCNLGWIFLSTNRPEKAEEAFREAVALQRRHLAESPSLPEFRLELAKYLFHLSNVLCRAAPSKDGEAARAEAIVLFKQLVAEYPNRPEFRQELADRGLQEEGR